MTDIAVGSRFGDFRVNRVLGEGGMGIVFHAERESDGHEVALKVLHGEMAADESLRERFIRESNYAASLDHPNIVPVVDAGDVDGTLFVAMGFIRGQNLREVLMREAPFGTGRTLSTLGPIADALEAVHAEGIIHRDVKPENILIASGEGPEDAGHPYLTDFGLGKDPTRDSGALTAIGQFVGTLNYTAPEQIMGQEPTRQADVYQFGCVLFECLTGRSPYAADNAADILKAQLDDRPPRVTEANPELPPALDEVLIRSLAKDPMARFESCLDVMTAAAEAIGSDLGAAPPPAPIMGGSTGATLRVEVTQGNAAGTRITVDDELMIGRLEESEGKLADDPELSRRHARIFRTGEEAYSIEDLGSTNGTFVNGMRVEGRPKALSAADVIIVGNTKLVVQPDGQPSGAAAIDAEAELTTAARGAPEDKAPAAAPPEHTPPTPAGPAAQPASAPAASAPAASAPAASAPSASAPVPSEPGTAGPAPPPLAVRVEIDPQAGEARLWFDEGSEPVRLVAEEGRWRVAGG